MPDTDAGKAAAGHHTDKSPEGASKPVCARPLRSGVLGRFIRKPAGEKKILAEAFLMAGLTRFVIRFCSFKVLKKLVGEPSDPSGTQQESATKPSASPSTLYGSTGIPSSSSGSARAPYDTHALTAGSPAESSDAPSYEAGDSSNFTSADAPSEPLLIARSVIAVSRRVPWESKCLVQASAARIMLNRRNIPNELFLGVPKSGLKSDKPPHAWLVVDGQVLLGGGNLDDYVTVSRFGS